MRGEIQHRERARQLRDFSRLCFGTITPTDIDGFVEFRDRLFIWIEAKLAGVSLSIGQRLALERQCDAVAETGRIAAVLIVEHDTPVERDIDLADCQVIEWRYKRAWQQPINQTTCRRAIEILLDKADIFL